mmetsp:Transcript_36563/g.95722  ORF Transcript_36563/g.95722 Transcript_36563/m.95722 type:complete len:105 (-) Transcript_36563:427-741(-)
MMLVTGHAMARASGSGKRLVLGLILLLGILEPSNRPQLLAVVTRWATEEANRIDRRARGVPVLRFVGELHLEPLSERVCQHAANNAANVGEVVATSTVDRRTIN